MRNRQELWLLHQVGKSYCSRPSAILGIADDWLAYQVDVATLLLGSQVDAMTQDGKQSVESALAELDRRDGAAAPRPERAVRSAFRPLAAPGIRKMKIPENGIW